MPYTLFDLKDGDLFEWQGAVYRLISIEEDKAQVRRCTVDVVAPVENFNPYAEIKPL